MLLFAALFVFRLQLQVASCRLSYSAFPSEEGIEGAELCLLSPSFGKTLPHSSWLRETLLPKIASWIVGAARRDICVSSTR